MSEQIGQRVVYRSEFRPSPELSYITLPLTGFLPTVEGAVRSDLPRIGDESYGARGLKLRSVAFATSGTSSGGPFEIHDGEIAFGFNFGASFENARRLLLEIAQAYERSSQQSPGGWSKERAALYASNTRIVVSLMDRMSANFEELKKTPDSQASIQLAQEMLGFPKPYKIGELLADRKIDLGSIWFHLALRHHIPIESPGFFSSLHSRYGHVGQMAAMLHGSTEAERAALNFLLDDRGRFLFYWALLFDSREGGANDPATWRPFEKDQAYRAFLKENETY